MIVWGALTCLMGAIQDFKHLVVLRVIIGCIEAGFAPGVLLVLSSWYKRTEQSRRFGVYISAAILSGAFGGLLAAVIVKNLEGVHGIRGWRWLFIVEGAATIGIALIALFVLPDFPANSRRLSEREKHVAVARLATENVTAMTEDSERLTHWKAVVMSVRDWRTWMFIIGYMVSRSRIVSLRFMWTYTVKRPLLALALCPTSIPLWSRVFSGTRQPKESTSSPFPYMPWRLFALASLRGSVTRSLTGAAWSLQPG
jgi:MFS family permease